MLHKFITITVYNSCLLHSPQLLYKYLQEKFVLEQQKSNGYASYLGIWEFFSSYEVPPGQNVQFSVGLGLVLGLSKLGWFGGVTVRVLDLRSSSRAFDSHRYQVTTVGSSHPCTSVTKQYHLVLANWRWPSVAGKVTDGAMMKAPVCYCWHCGFNTYWGS